MKSAYNITFQVGIFRSKKQHCNVNHKIVVQQLSWKQEVCFQQRCAIACGKTFRSVIFWTSKSNFCTFLHWSRYVPILMLLLNRRFPLIIKLKLIYKYLHSVSYWFYIEIKKVFFSVQFTSVWKVYLHTAYGNYSN